MVIKFLYKTEFSLIGTNESVLSGLEVNGRKVPFTGACEEIEQFGITAKEMAVYAADAQSVHFERELVYIPVRGARLNEKVLMEEIALLIVRAVAGCEVVRAAQISRVVSRW